MTHAYFPSSQNYDSIVTLIRHDGAGDRMPWFRNHTVCTACAGHWLAERAEKHDDDCPFCRATDVAPTKSDDWSVPVEPDGETYVVLSCAAITAQESQGLPEYRELGRFASRDEAKSFLAAR